MARKYLVLLYSSRDDDDRGSTSVAAFKIELRRTERVVAAENPVPELFGLGSSLTIYLSLLEVFR